jgi:hypothetical protein
MTPFSGNSVGVPRLFELFAAGEKAAVVNLHRVGFLRTGAAAFFG